MLAGDENKKRGRSGGMVKKGRKWKDERKIES
jgi:hypothetical protein